MSDKQTNLTVEEAIAIIGREIACVNKECNIERACGQCELVMPSKEPILEAYKMAIKALEQEPILDKIRAEIERLHYHPKLDFIKNDDVVNMALDIIDKNRAESEDNNAEVN